jgi:16S rRNA (guanine(966)-N(2))-methyltransferase RsmD
MDSYGIIGLAWAYPHWTRAGQGMRITGGTARGRLISCPEGLDVRPTASKIRQAFFNILAYKVPDCRFLDLFAGSGLMGLEAASRGAASLLVVEQTKLQVKAIEGNYQKLGLPGKVVCADVREFLRTLEPSSFDIIFADPPYRSTYPKLVLADVDKFQLLAANGVLAIEHARENQLAEKGHNLVRTDYREYGQTAISFYGYAEND